MKILAEQIEKLKSIHLRTMELLNALDRNNFDDYLNKVKMEMAEAESLKKELRRDYSAMELNVYNNDLLMLTKQIHEKFDNIIQERQNELDIISAELSNSLNKKKLANYNK